MALFNEIQVGRYNGILHKLLGMKEGAPAPQLSGDIVPAIILEAERPEWAFLAGVKIMVGHTELAAAAGNVSNIQLWNPLGSGVLAVLERIVVGVSTFKVLHISWSTVALTTNSISATRDSRAGIAVIQGAVQCRYQNSPAPLGTGAIARFYAGADYVTQLPMEFVISPGFGIIVSNSVQNASTSVNYIYRERSLEPSELR